MWVFFLLKWVRFFDTKHAAFFESGQKNAKKIEKSNRFLKILSMFLKEMVGLGAKYYYEAVLCTAMVLIKERFFTAFRMTTKLDSC